MPAVQSCDPAAHGRAYNTTFMSTLGVSMEIRWDWDEVSVWPACDGPLVNGSGQAGNWAVRAINGDTVPYYAHTTRRRDGEWMTYTINPGQTVTISAAQAAANGYSTIADFADLTLTTTP